MKHFSLLTKLLLGIVVGTLIGLSGHWFGLTDHVGYTSIVRLFATFNSLFSTFLAFIIPLIIVSFITVGLADLGKKANRLFGVTVLLAYGTTIASGFLAFFVGKLFLPSLIQPITGHIMDANSALPFFTIEVAPIFGVMTALVLSFVLGVGMANLPSTTLLEALRNLQNIIAMVLGKIIIPLIPIHIAGLFCNIASEGRLFATIKMFASLYLIILALQAFYILSQFVLASVLTKKNCLPKIKNIIPAYFTALGTQSSTSTIPVALECAYSNDVSEDVADFVVPLCATINLNGDTITLVLGAMGILLASGVEPTLAVFAPYIFMLGVTMVAAPGVPGGGVMASLGLIASMFQFTPAMQQLIIALHFSQDSFGTATNVSGDQAIALIVNEWDRKSS